jgi:hypothetical protein
MRALAATLLALLLTASAQAQTLKAGTANVLRATFQQLSLQNSWVAGADPSFRQGLYWAPLADGTVRLAGTISGGTTTPGTVIAVLPAAYHPATTMRIPVVVFDGAAWALGVLIVDTAGVISVQSLGGNVIVQLDGVSFSLR